MDQEFKVFKRMYELGVKLCVVTYTDLIDACGRVRNLGLALLPYMRIPAKFRGLPDSSVRNFLIPTTPL